MRSVRRVVNEFDKDSQIVSPKKRNTPNPFPKVDGFDLDAIRRIVHDFCKANESPTLKKIHAAGKGQTENKKKGDSSSSSKVSVENKDNDDNQGDSGLGIEQDYHDEMDHEKYENYFETQICKNVSKSSALNPIELIWGIEKTM